MVSQPSFIFGQVPRGDNYLLGSLLSVMVATLVGIFAVLSAKTRDVSVGIFMTMGGFTSMVAGLIHILAIAKQTTVPEKEELQVIKITY